MTARDLIIALYATDLKANVVISFHDDQGPDFDVAVDTVVEEGDKVRLESRGPGGQDGEQLGEAK